MDYASWGYALVGGAIIGIAAAIYLLFNGRIMGASGILGGLIDGSGRDTMRERLAFIIGLFGAPALFGLFINMPATNASKSIPILVIAGLLVGVGTRIGSGCTSGHGICGMSRLSVRSIVSTIIYIAAGGLMILAARALGVLS